MSEQEQDPYVRALLNTAQDVIKVGGTPSGMLVGVRDEVEKLCILLPWEEGEEEMGLLRYLLAITFVLSADCDTMYEMRDTFIRILPKGTELDDLPDDHPMPSEDPHSINALFVVQTKLPDASQTIVTQKYAINDQGKPEFHEVEVTATESKMDQGRMARILHLAIDKWRDAGCPLDTMENITERAQLTGFMGRVGERILTGE